MLLRPDADALPGSQLVEARPGKHTDVHEHFPAAVVGHDEAEALPAS